MEEADVVRIVESSIAKKNVNLLASMKSMLESSLTDLKRSHADTADSHLNQEVQGQVEGVVNSIFDSNDLSDNCHDEISHSNDLDAVVELKSLLNYEFTSGQPNTPSVRGRLALCYDEWVKVGASGFILSVVRDGYKIPFVALPPPKVSSNNTSALKDTDFVSEAISDLLRTKRVEILGHQPDIVNPLSVSVQPSGKKRLILDLRHVNLYVFKRKFRCEDISVAIQIFSKGYYLFKFDLKSGYHHVEIFRSTGNI